MTWTDYLCDFLELTGNEELTTHMSTIKRSHYGLLDINAKLGSFRELIDQVLASDIMREKLDEFIEERHALAAKKRGEALEEGRKRREKKEMAKAESNGNEHNGDVGKKHNDKNSSAEQKDSPEISGKKQDKTSEKNVKVDTEVTIASMKASNGKGSQKAIAVEKKETKDKIDVGQKKEKLEREMEKWLICTNPLGKDRDYNRYWFFRKDTRIFVESCDHKQWGYYTTKPELDSLMGSLNENGERERALKRQLEKRYN